MNNNEQSEIFSDEKSEDATGALIITTRTENSDDSKTHLSNDAPPSIETLTAEIKRYLHLANQSIIEVGKRLILAKEMLTHGAWQNWLKDNFNLSIPTARKFMQIYERFGITRDVARFDVSSFKASALVELLALPEGEEQKFIAEKAAEGNPADQMTIKQLRSEVQKWKDKSDKVAKELEDLSYKNNHLNSKLNFAQEQLTRKEQTIKDIGGFNVSLNRNVLDLKAQLAQRPTVEVPPPDYEDLKREVQELRNRPVEVATEFPLDYESTKKELAHLKNREDSFKKDYALNLSLNQIFSLIPTLLNADNLQSVVSVAADNDFSSLQHQLVQLAALHSQLQKHLKDWEVSHFNQTPIDRDSIISELKQLALQDMNNLTSAFLLALVKSFGFDDMSQVPDELLPGILRKMKTFQAFLLYI